jgi:hypothetical protein
MTPEDAWISIRAAATCRRPEMFDMFGAWPSRGDRGWSVRLNHDWVVEFREVAVALDVLVHSAERSRGLVTLLGDWEVREEIIRQAALDEVATSATDRCWSAVVARISEEMMRAVVAVPIAGMFTAVTDGEGYAVPLRLDDEAIVGHLDETLERCIDAFAKRQGLVGFRFSGHSWWTEELMTAKEDPQIGQELLEGHAEDGTWPWFVLATAVPAAGIAAEVRGLLAAEALAGALVLLDHPPGTYWSEGVPSIPGHGADAAPNDSPPTAEPQVVDGRALRLHTAVTASSLGPSPPALDAGGHITGPARKLLVQICSSGDEYQVLAGACRLALHAAAAWSPEAKQSLAGSAVRSLLVDRTAYESALHRGVAWREAQDAAWTKHAWRSEWRLDTPAWRDSLPAHEVVVDALGVDRAGFDMSNAELDGHTLLNVAQALLFARAAEIG